MLIVHPLNRFQLATARIQDLAAPAARSATSRWVRLLASIARLSRTAVG